MNYYEAREIRDKDTNEPTGRWHYTCANRRLGTWPVGYCRDHEGHESREEAEECYGAYQLDGARYDVRGSDDTQQRCEADDCDNWTQRGAELRHGGLHWLCDEHRNRATLDAMTATPSVIYSSY